MRTILTTAMKIDRIETSKHKKGRILLFLSDGTCLNITERECLDFALHSGDELSDETLSQIQAAASISRVKAKAVELIGKRAMSRRDLERKLKEKGASEKEVQDTVEWLESVGAIDDAGYAELLVRHYSQMGYGAARIRDKLYEKGVPRALWDDALDTLPPQDGQIDRFLETKLRGRIPDEQEKRRLTNALLRRGFSWHDVKAAWSRVGTEIDGEW